jgi:5-amino-6-(5-phosphoribosylamino)uracil reductase
MTDWRGRFARFADRKAAAAMGAPLSPYVTDFERPDADMVPVASEWTRGMFDGPFYLSPAVARELPAASLVFVQSRDGNTGAKNPADLGGGRTDAHVIYEGLSRVAADGVLAGAETIRGGDVLFSVWHPEIVRLRGALGLPRHPAQIVATLRGLSFDDALIYNVPDVRVLVLTVPDCARSMQGGLAPRPWITPIVMRDAHDLRAAFAGLHRAGLSRISIVGGRTIARALVDAGLVTDLYLTTAAEAGGEPNTPLFTRPIARHVIVRKHGTGEETGVRFEQWRLPLPAPPALPALLHDPDLEHLRPELARHEQAVARGVVRDAVQDVGPCAFGRREQAAQVDVADDAP